MATVATKPLTAEEYQALPDPGDGMRDELVQGEVILMPRPGFRHGRCQLRIATILDAYGSAKNHGRAATEVGILVERDPDTVRGPDVAYWSFERLPRDQEPTGFMSIAPEVCVEILSPSNRRSELRDKLREYFHIDVRMVWVIDPEDRTITIYRSVDNGHLYHEPASFTGEDLLPGFECTVAELFR